MLTRAKRKSVQNMLALIGMAMLLTSMIVLAREVSHTAPTVLNEVAPTAEYNQNLCYSDCTFTR